MRVARAEGVGRSGDCGEPEPEASPGGASQDSEGLSDRIGRRNVSEVSSKRAGAHLYISKRSRPWGSRC